MTAWTFLQITRPYVNKGQIFNACYAGIKDTEIYMQF